MISSVFQIPNDRQTFSCPYEPERISGKDGCDLTVKYETDCQKKEQTIYAVCHSALLTFARLANLIVIDRISDPILPHTNKVGKHQIHKHWILIDK
jgi:hypothetical protein